MQKTVAMSVEQQILQVLSRLAQSPTELGSEFMSNRKEARLTPSVIKRFDDHIRRGVCLCDECGGKPKDRGLSEQCRNKFVAQKLAAGKKGGEAAKIKFDIEAQERGMVLPPRYRKVSRVAKNPFAKLRQELSAG